MQLRLTQLGKERNMQALQLLMTHSLDYRDFCHFNYLREPIEKLVTSEK